MKVRDLSIYDTVHCETLQDMEIMCTLIKKYNPASWLKSEFWTLYRDRTYVRPALGNFGTNVCLTNYSFKASDFYISLTSEDYSELIKMSSELINDGFEPIFMVSYQNGVYKQLFYEKD